MKKTRILVAMSAAFFAISSAFTIYNQDDELEKSIERGKEIYISNCVSCHMEDGRGIASVFPPLAESDYLMEDLDRSIRQVLEGASGEMEVNGVVYNGVMTGFDLTDQEVADVLNYVRSSWGNSGEMVTAERVSKIR